MNKVIFISLVFLILIIPFSFAQKNTIKLLAIDDSTKQGVIVDLDLTITDGSGKVFIETYPLSQIDTQISLRVAKIIACKISEKYCPAKDFAYSLKTTTPVVAGPSAGAAMALLTWASLENKKLNTDIIMTGTINSGGAVGIVGSVKEKIKAAEDAGLKKVLIPRGEANGTELAEYGKNLNITVIEISNIEQAYEIFTNEKISYPRLTVDSRYSDIMKTLNTEICRRTEKIKEQLSEENTIIKEQGLNLSREAELLSLKGKYYSSASRCFGANVYLRDALLRESEIDFEKEKENVKNDLKRLELEINSTKITNLGKLEAVMIIRERIFDARKNLQEVNSTDSTRELSYAIERTYSANAWKKFLGFPGKEIDEEKLKQSCIMKIEEVQELYNYVALYVPLLLQETKEELDTAKEYFNNEDYALCLFKASKSEAEINAALSALYIEEKNVDILLENKILAAKKEIQKQIKKGTFPILGYSYYEYAAALENNDDKYIRLLYAEYGIELSNLDIYFPQKIPFNVRLNEKALITLILGFIMGVALFLRRKVYKRKKIVLRR